MAVHYVRLPAAISRDRKSVSVQWASALLDMYHDGVSFNVNEGHRTMARQAELVRLKGLWSPSNPTGAAAPSPYAPHIRTGRIDHAIDFSNDSAVYSWLSRHGLRPARTVAAERWHIECPASALEAYYQRHVVAARKAKADHNKRVKHLLREAGYSGLSTDGAFGSDARHKLKLFQQEQGLKQDGIAGPKTMHYLRHPSPTIRPKGKTSGHGLKAAKRLLRRNGRKSVVLDFGRGPLYRRAVKGFKKKHHLPADSIVGPATWKALRK